MTDIHKMTGPHLQHKPIDVNAPMTADIVGQASRCKTLSNVRYDVTYTVTGVPVGVLSVQVCESGIEADFVNYPLLASMVTIVSGDGNLNAGGTIDVSGIGAGRILLNMTDAFGFVRPKWKFTSDGTGAVMNIFGGAR